MTVAMTMAGSDPSGGASLQADLKTSPARRLRHEPRHVADRADMQKVESVEVLAPEFWIGLSVHDYSVAKPISHQAFIPPVTLRARR